MNIQEERTNIAAPVGEATQQRPRSTTRTRRTTGQNRRTTVKAEGNVPVVRVHKAIMASAVNLIVVRVNHNVPIQLWKNMNK